ncbi:hypothetical protein TNCV_840381 [Trichonephila clavipes]|nr:hypothetical protein TNCV_840381 [Trichonephila clavipes]
MSPRRDREKFQQLTDFEQGRVIGLREGGFFLSRNRSSCAAEQFHSDASLEAVIDGSPTHATSSLVCLFAGYYSEHVWDLVGRHLNREPRPAASKDELLLRIQSIWNSLPQADIHKLFDSMPRRIAALIAVRGGYIKY